MCGRYRLAAPVEQLVEVFGLFADGLPTLRPRYNIAPTQLAPVVVGPEGERVLRRMRWGLLPGWARDARDGARMINARADTAPTKPAFRAAFRRRRCLVPADGWYEWQATEGPRKAPWWFHRPDHGLLAFAGLWETWRPPEGDPVETFTVLTTDADRVSAPVHDRMPVVLPPAAWRAWSDPEADPASLIPLLVPAAAGTVVRTPVGPAVGSVRNDDPSLCAPVGPPVG